MKAIRGLKVLYSTKIQSVSRANPTRCLPSLFINILLISTRPSYKFSFIGMKNRLTETLDNIFRVIFERLFNVFTQYLLEYRFTQLILQGCNQSKKLVTFNPLIIKTKKCWLGLIGVSGNLHASPR